ncbi:hypothetical protein EHQ45_08965 [Leptospira bourretii]|nr:hypothetical protein EHQ45_08965 [Leptospira bourretii]
MITNLLAPHYHLVDKNQKIKRPRFTLQSFALQKDFRSNRFLSFATLRDTAPFIACHPGKLASTMTLYGSSLFKLLGLYQFECYD